MSINATVERLYDGTWKFSWTPGSSGATYDVWLDGEQLASELVDEEYTYTGVVYLDQAPPLEIVETGDPVGNELYPPRVTLQWRGLLSAVGYQVQQYIDSVWTDIIHIMEEQKGYYQWTSDALSDDDSHQFRVAAFDLNGNEGTPISFSMVMARNPAPPDVDLSIDSSGDVVVSAA